MGPRWGAADRDAGAAQGLEPVLEHLDVGEVVGDEDKLGDFGGAVVILANEVVEHLGLGFLASDGQLVVVVADELAAADAEDGGHGVAVLADGGDDVDLAFTGVGI